MPNMNVIIRDVRRMESTIESARMDEQKMIGRLESLNKQMKDQFGLESDEEVTKELDKLDVELTKIDKRIEKKYEAISEKYEW